MLFFRIFTLAVTAILCGCAAVSDKAAPIQVHMQISSVLDKCKKLGPVVASVSSLHPDSRGALEVKLREATADIGGDSVAILNMDSQLTQDRLQGIAFKCF